MPLNQFNMQTSDMATLKSKSHLVAGYLRSVDPDVEDVVACAGAVHGEAVGAVQPRLLQAAPRAVHLGWKVWTK